MKPLIWIDNERHNVKISLWKLGLKNTVKSKPPSRCFYRLRTNITASKSKKKKSTQKNQDNLWNITWWLDHFCSYYFFWSNTKYNVPLFDLRDINVLCIFPQVFIYQPKFKQKSNLLRQRWVVYPLTLTKTSMKRTQYWNLQKQS